MFQLAHILFDLILVRCGLGGRGAAIGLVVAYCLVVIGFESQELTSSVL